MIKSLNNIYLRQLFNPTVLSLIINPFYFYRRLLYQSIGALAPKLTGRLLDFGCGLKPYKDLFINAEVYFGVDVENPGHDHSKEDIDLYYDGNTLPLAEHSFDSVFCSEVLEHVPDLDQSISEISRVLKPNGQLLVTVPFFWMEHEMPHDYRRFTKGGIEEVLKIAGFEMIESCSVAHFTTSIFQMWSMYIYSFYQNQNKYLRMLLTAIFISPVNIVGSILAFILPKQKGLYLGSVILCRKVENENTAH